MRNARAILASVWSTPIIFGAFFDVRRHVPACTKNGNDIDRINFCGGRK